ncbi:MAG TPA: ketoacyl-ACP synthase III [Desulfobacteraceae bacterium]|nr:ketoacyl-ACP synthase III [Desulfobacteraceae bacterium]HPJ68426.1 ketoacyl-ACP synthase III [Desulfobacteraceae bacterium]HPQ28534.1 ketoacyl-ACP synthase III [Desulfobacteraceae bacterium]
MPNSIITKTGSYIPTLKVPNADFLKHDFYDTDGKRLTKSNAEIIEKFQEITCIKERRYIEDNLNTSDIAFLAAEQALDGVDRETLDYILVAHNFGNICADNIRSDMTPTLAARVKYKLGIKNPYTVAYDVPFGCPGWLNCMVIADYYIKSGDAKKVLVIGSETLSRIYDPHDIDGMIYADGAGAALIESTDKDAGILSHVTRSDTFNELDMLNLNKSYNPEHKGNELFLKMKGHEVYKYAVKTVPVVVRESLEKAGLTLSDVKKVLIHQANEKMDEAILKRLFKLYKTRDIPERIMPMIISWLGNSSVATLPTLFDLLQKGKLHNHILHTGDIAVFASVGAGMNINSVVYRMP